jgi:hypothetical protein
VESFRSGDQDSVVAPDGTVYAIPADGRRIVEAKGGDAALLGPAEVEGRIGAELLTLDSRAGTVWFTADGQSNIFALSLTDGSVDAFELPYEVISGDETHCIGRYGECPEEVTLRTLVGGLIPDGKGNLYFSDVTLNRIGILYVD